MVLFPSEVLLLFVTTCCCCCFMGEAADAVIELDPVVLAVIVAPVTFTLEYDTTEGLFVQVYLAVILLFGPCFIVVYLDVKIKFHFE